MNSTTERGFVVLFFHAAKTFLPGRSWTAVRRSAERMRKRNYIKNGRSFRAAWKQRLVVAGAVLFALYLLTSFIFGEMGVVKYYRMKAQYNALTGEIAKLKRDNAKFTKQVRALRSDPAYLERLARDKLGLARPGEIVYYYGDQ